MAAEKRNAGLSLALRRAHRIEDNLGIEPLFSFRLVDRRTNRAGAGRRARAFFGDCRKALLIVGLLRRPVHLAHAAMLAILAAATGAMIRLRVQGKQRRNQRPTEEHHQRDGDGAAHGNVPV